MQGVDTDPLIQVDACAEPLGPDALGRLREALAGCPDLAFCYLGDVRVDGRGEASPTLMVWLEGRAVGSIRSALNLVSSLVAKSLPPDRYLDVIILNSAPELLSEVVAGAELLVEVNPDERLRALDALQRHSECDPNPAAPADDAPWWIRLFRG